MNYTQAMEYIRQTAVFGSKLGLENITLLMKLLGDPQEGMNFVHIAGTNGKGSVAAYICDVLQKAGYRTGFYTSPALSRFSQRIRLDGEEIPEDDIAFYATKVREKAECMSANSLGDPTEFELVMAMAFCWFRDRGADVVVLEVGMGGRLDATNVISDPKLCIITKVSYDHMQYLGDTLPEIAGEKAGIIKQGSRVLAYPQEQDVWDVYEKVCREKEADLHRAILPTDIRGSMEEGLSFTLGGREYVTSMRGIYETENAAVAIQACTLLESEFPRITDEIIRSGIASTCWEGRFEVLSKDPLIIADGAHNADGAAALAGSLGFYFPGKKVELFMGILEDKEYDRMLEHLLPLASKVTVCTVPSPRTLEAQELRGIIEKAAPELPVCEADDLREAAKDMIKPRPEAGVCVICGSLYLVGPMRELILKEKASLRENLR